MAPISIRDGKSSVTRARIAGAALELFASRGFDETTIDQIATAARVGRRTIFRHFPTKEAILFDHLVVRRNTAVKLLQERPSGEPPLVSLHAVLRELCAQGYDRRALAQIRDVLAVSPGLAAQQFSVGMAFESNVFAAIQSRLGDSSSSLEIYALTLMALSWLTAATRLYVQGRRSSLVQCFDEIVTACLRAVGSDLAASLGVSAAPRRRTKARKRTVRGAHRA